MNLQTKSFSQTILNKELIENGFIQAEINEPEINHLKAFQFNISQTRKQSTWHHTTKSS